MFTTESSNDNLDDKLSSPAAETVGLSDIGMSTEKNEQGLTTDTNMTSWRTAIETSIARSRKIRGGNYVQISTVDPLTMEPRCRTVVFRGFLNVTNSASAILKECVDCDEKSCIMKMITDNRSNKVTEASANAVAEMVWWFSKSSEQYRIRGNLIFVGGGQFEFDNDTEVKNARKEQWGNLSDMAREQFFWEEPGIPYSGESKVPAGGRDENGKILPPPDTFLIMLLLPKRIDYLRLTDNYRQIDEVSDGSWERNRVNP